MNGLGIKVRCLASTRILARHQGKEWAETDDNGQNEDGSDGPDLENVDSTSVVESSTHTEDPKLEHDSNEPGPRSPASATISSSDSTLDFEENNDSACSVPCLASTRHISCIQEAQLSPDGSCIFTSDYGRNFSVYPISNDILSEAETRTLDSYASFKSPDPIWAFAVNPLFNLQDPASTTVLLSRRDSYITLHNALHDATTVFSDSDNQPSSIGPVNISTPLASYKLVNSLTEAVTAPLSLSFSRDSNHFFAGARDKIAIFDIQERDAPIHTISTIPAKRNKLKGGGRGFKGHISALSLSPPTISSTDGLIAAGSWTRYVGIYDSVSGAEVTHFPLPGTNSPSLSSEKMPHNETLSHIMGSGVSSLKWSPCGRYLYVAERSSDALLIYDVRNFSYSLAHCTGRKAVTTQKLGFDIWNAGQSPYDIEGASHEVWAGGTDGRIRVWRDPYVKEGAVEPDEVIQIHEEEGEIPVVGTLVHASGSLAVAARGIIEVGDEIKTQGERKGSALRPEICEWGYLDILGLE
ncbi:WD repeat-containing [Pyrenophora seminiperda CCB06]|uniref:WD repeat-containing n=1 Tax=Pyrenophora seminiperda CCB06 TaxID=1302712 RepID=A0A3M7M303_9PLEO|nr:WD repeat-containing [Pyrenophora seminiperda CCB06]